MSGPVSPKLEIVDGNPPRLAAAWPPERASLDEVEHVFVRNAPFSQERALRFDLLRYHAEIVQRAVGKERLYMWINGGFVTHKAWRQPRDVDVVYFTTETGLKLLTNGTRASLWTLSSVTATIGAKGPKVQLESLQPMANMVDAYVALDMPPPAQPVGTPLE